MLVDLRPESQKNAPQPIYGPGGQLMTSQKKKKRSWKKIIFNTTLLIAIIVGLTIMMRTENKASAYVKQLYFDIFNNLPKVEPSSAFSVIVIPDTQMYSEKYPEIFCDQTSWILQSKKKLNTLFAVHLGDIVNNGASKKNEWETASKCMGLLDGRIPYSVLPGNHDYDTPHVRSSGNATYNTYFPASRYSDNSWYKGHYKENQNSYQMIEVFGKEYLFLSLEVEADDSALNWAEEVVKAHPNAYTTVSMHKYLRDKEGTRDRKVSFGKGGNSPESIWTKLIKPNCSIKLVLSGHYHDSDGENQRLSTNACGQRVNQVVQDYQAQETGGNGKLRIYTFKPYDGVIDVMTYSPYTNEFETDSDSQFTLRMK